MHHELRVLRDEEAAVSAAADDLAARARAAVAHHGTFTLAVSGGHTPRRMFAELATMDVPWSDTTVFQVDERVAPLDDEDRNLRHLYEALGDAPVRVLAMPVEESDLAAAAAAYQRQLPEAFDVVHLGMGPDGHTASLVPGDPVLDVSDRDVAVTAHPYQGRRRMTLTYAGLRRASQLVWLVTGEDKSDVVSQLLRGSAAIPAGRVVAGSSLVITDAAAAPRVATT
jgi:6-phosphogluconolactonase